MRLRLFTTGIRVLQLRPKSSSMNQPSQTLPPTAENDEVSLESTSVTLNVLANDSDPDGDALTLEWAGNGNNGIVTINDDDTVTYHKGGRNRKTDTFHYIVSDGRDTDTATVKVDFGSRDNKTIGIGRNK
jgi:hypothetical protein